MILKYVFDKIIIIKNNIYIRYLTILLLLQIVTHFLFDNIFGFILLSFIYLPFIHAAHIKKSSEKIFSFKEFAIYFFTIYSAVYIVFSFGIIKEILNIPLLEFEKFDFYIILITNIILYTYYEYKDIKILNKSMFIELFVIFLFCLFKKLYFNEDFDNIFYFVLIAIWLLIYLYLVASSIYNKESRFIKHYAYVFIAIILMFNETVNSLYIDSKKFLNMGYCTNIPYNLNIIKEGSGKVIIYKSDIAELRDNIKLSILKHSKILNLFNNNIKITSKIELDKNTVTSPYISSLVVFNDKYLNSDIGLKEKFTDADKDDLKTRYQEKKLYTVVRIGNALIKDLDKIIDIGGGNLNDKKFIIYSCN